MQSSPASASPPSSSSPSSVRFESVTRTYVTKTEMVNALDSISLEVQRGAVVAVVGPSGSGKTTLLNMIAALDFPTSGTVTVDGVRTSDLAGEHLQKFRNLTVGVVFQQFFLVDHLTVFGNVMVPLIPRELSSKEKKERILAAIRRVGLAGKEERFPSELSGGELQRVAIARGMVGDAKVLLCDEPTGNLDSKKGAEIVELLVAESKQGGKTVLIATHDLRILDLVDGVAYLQDGRLANASGSGIRVG